ncbi:hypothetical protein [Allochromatium tepidum]|uniref:Response regulatory domain-containing protein n=1 Tax=Allochromatium tepidum TaxID=553982 RepID=A0ABN6GCX5_9GAMM|nr:hypothetical protein [Allochromatium tepidum]BCU07423.1 hypothetical protein Atep_21000 [Allochromatium tepidum]
MSASDLDEDIGYGYDAGMNDRIPKPVDPQVLYRTLLKWLP